MPKVKSQNQTVPRLTKVLSVAGLVALIAFFLGILFVGFFSLDVKCARKEVGQAPDCEIREVRLFGLFDRRAAVSSVSDIGYRTQDTDTSSRVTLSSTVVLSGSNGTLPISQAASNVGNAWKADLIKKLNQFLETPNERTLTLQINERNLFGWIGLACLAFILLSYTVWFIRKLRLRP